MIGYTMATLFSWISRIIIIIMEPDRDFVPARRDVAELAELADLEKVSVVSYNVLSQMGARRLQRAGSGYVGASILTIARRREKLLRCG